jgi:hypothetical protein
MKIRIGYERIYACPQPTPMILTLDERSSLAAQRKKSKNVGFLKLDRQFAAAPTFPAKPLRNCRLVKRIVGKP